MKTNLFLFPFFLTLAAPLHAGQRTSTNYGFATDSVDSAGAKSASVNYTNDGSMGGITGIPTATVPAVTMKNGYIGQLYEVTSLTLSAPSLTVNETGTLQLAATQVLDDSTTADLTSSAVLWSVLGGPISGISGSGLLIAATVYQNTAASVQGSYAGLSGSFGLTVTNTLIDNFGSYAGDGIDDAWQYQYFGLNNPNAAPGFLSDGSGHDNLFKYIAGLIPNNTASKFTVGTQPTGSQPAPRDIIFGPTFANRQYTIQHSSTLGSWQNLTSPLSGNGGTYTFTDISTGAARKFYRIVVEKP